MRVTWGTRTGQAIMIIGIAAFMIPIYWLAKSAFSGEQQLYKDPPQLFPIPFTIKGFQETFGSIVPSLATSAIIAIGCVILTLIVALPTAYALNLLSGGIGSGLSRLAVLASLMFPTIMFVIPLYNLFYDVKLLNTIPGLVIADSIYGIPLGVMVCFTYFSTIPQEIVEAAIVDGASSLRIFLRVICPLSMPAIATTAIFAFLFGWGDFLFGTTFGAGRGKSPATVLIAGMVQGALGTTPWNQVMAASVLLSLPALIAIIFAQRYITSGLSAGAVK